MICVCILFSVGAVPPSVPRPFSHHRRVRAAAEAHDGHVAVPRRDDRRRPPPLPGHDPPPGLAVPNPPPQPPTRGPSRPAGTPAVVSTFYSFLAAYRLLEDFGSLRPGDTIIQSGAESLVGMVCLLLSMYSIRCIRAECCT